MSPNQYARHRGCTLRAVQKAMGDAGLDGKRDGRISAALVDVPGERFQKIDQAKADLLWEKNTDVAKRSVLFTPDLPEAVDEASVPDTPAAPSEISGEKHEYQKARTARELINLRNEQLDLEERLGTLLSIDDAVELGSTTLRSLRDALRNIGARISPQLAAMTEPHEVEQLINMEIDAALSGITVENLLKPIDDEPEDNIAAQGE